MGGLFILIGSAVITSAQNVHAFMGGRVGSDHTIYLSCFHNQQFVLGFGVSISTTAAPTWVTELAPPQWRGRLGAFYNSCFFIGQMPATGAMVGTIKMNSTWAWRLPSILQVIPPTIKCHHHDLCIPMPRIPPLARPTR